MEKQLMHGPVKITAEFYYDIGDGVVAQVEYEFPPGRIPTREEVEKALGDVAKEIGSKDEPVTPLPRPEFFNEIVKERFGTSTAFASPDAWDK